jgi:O-antigen ligase/tetratricopeptide (TPR) repeat protein
MSPSDQKNQLGNQGIARKLYYLILGGLGLCLLTPFIISASTYFPFVVGKALAFQILVEIVFFLYLLLNLFSKDYRPKFGILNWAILVYFGIVTISSVFGIDRIFSFWTNYERMDGLFNLYHFGAYAFLLANILRKKKDWLNFLRFLLGTFVLIDFLGLLQKMGLSYLAQFGGDRAFSTLGNATYMGVQAVFQFFLAAFLFFSDKNLWWRIFYIFNGFCGVLAIFISKTRGSILSVFIGVIIFLILSSLFSKKRKFYISIFGGIVIAIGLLAFIFSHPDWKIAKILPQRLNVFSSNLSLETRGVVWNIALSAWKDRPIMGWGVASHGFLFAPYYNPQAASFEDVWFDKPHNKIIEVMVDSGIVGLGGYLSIFGVVIYAFWKRRNVLGESSFALISLVFAYIVGLLFLFDFQASYLWWYTILGFTGFILINEKPEKKERASQESLCLVIFIVGSLILGFCFVRGNTRPLMAAKQGLVALKMEYSGQGAEKVLPIYRSAIGLNTFGNREILSEMYKPFGTIRTNSGKEALKPYLDFAIKEGEKIYKENPHDLKNSLILAQLYLTGYEFDSNNLDRAENIYLNYLKKAPNKFDSYYSLALISLQKQKLEDVGSYLDKAMMLNLRYYRSFWEAARIHFMVKDSINGRLLLARAISISDRFPWTNLIRADFLTKEDTQWFVGIFERLGKVEPNWNYPPLILAGLYGNLKNNDKFVYYLKESVKDSPETKKDMENMFNIKLDNM